jgi:hypothetical protein
MDKPELLSVWILPLFLTAAYPLLQAWRHYRRTSLAHAVLWTSVAWLGWSALLFFALPLALRSPSAFVAGRYAALCLIGCAGVAVLGARQPGAGAWNFVVLGLLAVFLLSWAEGFLTGSEVEIGPVRAIFLAGTLGVVVLNYLPTRLGPAAMLLATGCTWEFWNLLRPDTGKAAPLHFPADLALSGAFLGVAVWSAWATIRFRPAPPSAVDQLWRDFRDAYGLFWAARLRDQFNRSAVHAGLGVELRWRGLTNVARAAPPDASQAAASLELLQALLKRFGLLSAGGERSYEANARASSR